ncbi:MAG TPA: hypothetical protein VMM60_05170, partial [Ilumatobacter sp.]|nr:hypothetical protein [Ilumatobacter sp.]
AKTSGLGRRQSAQTRLASVPIRFPDHSRARAPVAATRLEWWDRPQLGRDKGCLLLCPQLLANLGERPQPEG